MASLAVRFDDVPNSGSSLSSTMVVDAVAPVSEFAEFTVGGTTYAVAGGVTSNGYQVMQYQSSDLTLVYIGFPIEYEKSNYAY